jgi:hypothetical protein
LISGAREQLQATTSSNAPIEQCDVQLLKGLLSSAAMIIGRRKGIKMPAARYALPFILTLTNLHTQAITTAIVTVIRTPETSIAYVTPTLSTAAAIPDINTDILDNNNNDNTV